MLPLRVVSERAFAASHELDSILPKVYDIRNQTNIFGGLRLRRTRRNHLAG
eukprot:COSAG02_NODE_146_length_33985_cov_263.461695_23_plen_51_part_00